MKQNCNRKIFVTMVRFLWIVAVAVVLPLKNAEAAADTCTWDGSSNGNWNNANNWFGCDNGNLPENGDTLFFPTAPVPGTTNVNNDFPPLTVNQVQFPGVSNNGNYVVGGNSLTISGSFIALNSGNNQLNLPLSFTGVNSQFSQPFATTNAINGNVSLNPANPSVSGFSLTTASNGAALSFGPS